MYSTGNGWCCERNAFRKLMNDMISTFHSEDDFIIAKSEQDVSPIIVDCKNLRDIGATGSNEMKHAANFPMVLIEAYLNKTGIEYGELLRNPAHIKSMLNDPDLKAFRIWEGRC